MAAVVCAPGLARAGELTGVVLDKSSYQPLPGVTIVACSPALQAMEVEITDDEGRYIFSGLPAAVYEVSFYYADSTVRRSGVLVPVEGRVYANLVMTVESSDCCCCFPDAPPIVPDTITVDDRRTTEELLAIPRAPAGLTRTGATRRIHGLRLPDDAAPLSDALFDEYDLHEYGYEATIGGAGTVIDLSPRSGANQTRGFARARAGRRAADGAVGLAGPLSQDHAWYALTIAPRADRAERATSAMAEVNVAASPEQQGWALALADRAIATGGEATRTTRGAAVGWLSRLDDNRLELETALGRFSTATVLPGAAATTTRDDATLAARERIRAWGHHRAEVGASGAREVSLHPDVKRGFARDERAAWIHDAWNLRPNVLATAGLRWEREHVADAAGDRDRGGLSPRLGLLYDWTNEGRARLWGSWGRYRDPARGLSFDSTVLGVEHELGYDVSAGAAYVRRGTADGALLFLHTRARWLNGSAEYRVGQRDPILGTRQSLTVEMSSLLDLCFARGLLFAAGLRFGAGAPSYLAAGKRWKVGDDPLDVTLQLADLTGRPAVQLAAQLGF